MFENLLIFIFLEASSNVMLTITIYIQNSEHIDAYVTQITLKGL